LDLLNNNGTGKADTGSYHCSRYSLFGKAERKTTYRCREPALISVSLPKYFTLVGTNFIESAKIQALAIAPMPALLLQT
jgi:hypothetical protein